MPAVKEKFAKPRCYQYHYGPITHEWSDKLAENTMFHVDCEGCLTMLAFIGRLAENKLNALP